MGRHFACRAASSRITQDPEKRGDSERGRIFHSNSHIKTFSLGEILGARKERLKEGRRKEGRKEGKKEGKEGGKKERRKEGKKEGRIK